MRLFLFGPPRLAQRDDWVALPFERRSQLLVHLALRGTRVPRTEVAEILWPHVPIEQAHANLRKTLFRTRTLPWGPAVVAQDQCLDFDGDSDVADFHAAIEQQRWADALEIASAPLLAGFDDDASEPWSVWLRAERERLRAAWYHAARQCLADATDTAQALALSSRLLADDPLDELALRAQMLAHAAQGQPARGREAYRRYAAQLNSALGAAPPADLQALHDALGLPDDTLAASQVPADRIVGRATERQTVAQRLEQGCRLLTLVGPGGVGKSRLARHLQSELAPRYADGAVYVPLDDVEVHAAVGARLARELSVPLDGSTEPLRAVIAFLRGRRMLLVLDNAEHLQAAAPQLQMLLDACPQVQMLVTSRTRLGLASEHLLPLGGLPCPEAEDADRLESFDAAQLFVRAARAVDPALNPAAEAAAIAHICRLVDGLPLALEIAAGWTRVLPCAGIAAELQRGIELLTEADATRPARHASMAAVFEQSWRRLNLAERSTWARLTVFHGGYTLDAARAVTGATLPVLAALIDQSLVCKTGARADLHPLLRQLAAAQLAHDDRDAACNAHAQYYLQALVPLLDRLRSGDRQAFAEVDAEFENLRAAWHWASRHQLADALLPAIVPLVRYCDVGGHRAEGLALLRAAAADAGDNQRLQLLLDAASAHMQMRLGRYADAQVLAERTLRAAAMLRDHDTLLFCYRTLGGCALQLGRLARARRRWRQALAQAPAAVDPYNAAAMLQNLGLVESVLGRVDEARMLFVQALVEFRRLNAVSGIAMCLSNLATLGLDFGQLDAASAPLEEALALCERHALKSTMLGTLANLTELSVRRFDAAAALRHGRRALELAEQMDARNVQATVQLHLVQLALQQRQLAAARNTLQAAVEHAIALDHASLQLDCVLGFAGLLHAQGEPRVATRLLHYAIDHPATRASSRSQARGRLAEWAPSQPVVAQPASAVELWTLLHRIVGETPLAHAPLIAALRAP